MSGYTLWNMSTDVACLFYEVCKELNAETEEEKAQILSAMAQMGLMNSVSTTNRTKEQIITDYAKHYRVLHIKAKKDEESKSNS